MVKSRNQDSLENAISLALAEEQVLISLQKMFKVNCNICKNLNHSTNNCRYKNQPEKNIRFFKIKIPIKIMIEMDNRIIPGVNNFVVIVKARTLNKRMSEKTI